MNQPERILLWGSNLWLFADGMLGPLFAVFSERIGGNILDITWAWATYLGATGVFVILVGAWSDYVSKERMLVAGYAVTAFFTFGYLFVETPFDLILVQAGLGIGLGLCNPTWSALYSEHMSPHRKGFSWGLVDGMGKMLTAVAILIGGIIVRHGSFRALFIAMGIMQVIATIYQAQLLQYSLPQTLPEKRGKKRART